MCCHGPAEPSRSMLPSLTLLVYGAARLEKAVSLLLIRAILSEEAKSTESFEVARAAHVHGRAFLGAACLGVALEHPGLLLQRRPKLRA